jgi:hypothetical protein
MATPLILGAAQRPFLPQRPAAASHRPGTTGGRVTCAASPLGGARFEIALPIIGRGAP